MFDAFSPQKQRFLKATFVSFQNQVEINSQFQGHPSNLSVSGNGNGINWISDNKVVKIF